MQSPYDISSDEEGYFFTTVLNVTYRIVFDDLSSLFIQYPALKGRVFSFSFYPTNPINRSERNRKDERIKLTIANSIFTFFAREDNLIIFVCDSTDKRELSRKKLFDKWFYEFNSEKLLEKYDGSIGDGENRIINSILMKSDLTDKSLVVEVFKSLNDEFTQAK